MRITQAKVSYTLDAFEDSFMRKFGFSCYTDRTCPVVFFGCYIPGGNYRRRDVKCVVEHKSLAVLVWGGSDALSLLAKPEVYEGLRTAKHVKHVAISRFVADDLDKAGLPYTRLPVCPTDANNGMFSSVPLGDSVYMYLPQAGDKIYGGDVLDDIKRRLSDVNFITCCNGDYPEGKMPEIYSKCFMGLRLTKHDGLPNTVVQLGLMGRRCVWNGDLSNSIPWKTARDVVVAIEAEVARIGTSHPEVAEAIIRDITMPSDWLDSSFWGASDLRKFHARLKFGRAGRQQIPRQGPWELSGELSRDAKRRLGQI